MLGDGFRVSGVVTSFQLSPGMKRQINSSHIFVRVGSLSSGFMIHATKSAFGESASTDLGTCVKTN